MLDNRQEELLWKSLSTPVTVHKIHRTQCGHPCHQRLRPHLDPASGIRWAIPGAPDLPTVRHLLLASFQCTTIHKSSQTGIDRQGEATRLFAQPRNDGLASALATIEQGFGDELYYPNVAMRAAHLLYFIIKGHPFADGNKRTASFLFIWYLRINQHLLAQPVEDLINDNALVALTLLVAESLPEQKTLMIRLIENFVLMKDA